MLPAACTLYVLNPTGEVRYRRYFWKNKLFYFFDLNLLDEQPLHTEAAKQQRAQRILCEKSAESFYCVRTTRRCRDTHLRTLMIREANLSAVFVNTFLRFFCDLSVLRVKLQGQIPRNPGTPRYEVRYFH